MNILRKLFDTKSSEYKCFALSLLVIGIVGLIFESSNGYISNTEISILYSLFWIGIIMLFLRSASLRKEKKLQKEIQKKQALQAEYATQAAQYYASPIVQAVKKIERGYLPIITSPSIVKRDEITHLTCQAIRYITKNRVTGRTSSYGGASFRVAKGITIRTGGGEGHSIYGDVTSEFKGEFILTNKRALFIHGQHGFECTLSSLSAISGDDSGKVIIQKGNTSCVLRFVANTYNGQNRLLEWDCAELLIRAISLINNQQYNNIENPFHDDLNSDSQRIEDSGLGSVESEPFMGYGRSSF